MFLTKRLQKTIIVPTQALVHRRHANGADDYGNDQQTLNDGHRTSTARCRSGK